MTAKTAVSGARNETPKPTRPRARRRCLPLGRGARLLVKGRTHIVGLGDVSTTGAYLITRLDLPAGEEHELRVVLPPTLPEIVLRVRVVRLVRAGEEGPQRPQGLAVEFVEPGARARTGLEKLVRAERALREGVPNPGGLLSLPLRRRLTRNSR